MCLVTSSTTTATIAALSAVALSALCGTPGMSGGSGAPPSPSSPHHRSDRRAWSSSSSTTGAVGKLRGGGGQYDSGGDENNDDHASSPTAIPSWRDRRAFLIAVAPGGTSTMPLSPSACRWARPGPTPPPRGGGRGRRGRGGGRGQRSHGGWREGRFRPGVLPVQTPGGGRSTTRDVVGPRLPGRAFIEIIFVLGNHYH